MRKLLAITALFCSVIVAHAQYSGDKSNVSGVASQVATPSFSPGGGSYSSTQTVTISTATSLAVLCYTTDGSTPTESGHLCSGGTTSTYSTPISVATTQTVKAIGTLATYTDSAVDSATYTISTTYTDNFPGSSLSGNWTCYAGTGWGVPTVASNTVQNNQDTGNKSFCGYTGGSFATNQTTQATVSVLGSGPGRQALCVNMNPTTGNGYCQFWDVDVTGNFEIVKITAGAYAFISGYCGGGPSSGDITRFTNTAGTLVSYDVTTSTTLCTATDSTYTGGSPGFFLANSIYVVLNAFSTWSGK